MTDPIRKSPEGLTPPEQLNPIDQSNNEALKSVETENQESVHVGSGVDSELNQEESGEQAVVDQPADSVESVLEPEAVLEPESASDAQDKLMTEHLLKDSSGLDNASEARRLLEDIINPGA